jgi:2-phosphoglycerate kinase
MIYLLGGPMRVGKSLIARRFRERASISVISTDDISRVLRDGAPHLGITYEMPIAKECEALWPFIRALISIRLDRDEPLLIEGAGISPRRAAQAQQEFVGGVRACFVGELTVRPQQKLRMLRAYSEAHGDWLAGKPSETYKETVRTIRAVSEEYKRDCGVLGIAFFDMGENFDESVAAVVEYLVTGEARPQPRTSE